MLDSLLNIIRFSHPLTSGLSVDDPKTTQLRRQIIAEKPFLKKIYSEWYFLINSALDDREVVLELGSGAGFFKSIRPNIITSEVFFLDGVDLIGDACQLPVSDHSLDGIVMTNVFHHLPDVTSFLDEATRCMKSGGKIIMIEPWNTPWSRWIHARFHSEPFDVNSTWSLSGMGGPLSLANGALPWIVFNRDQSIFNEKYPNIAINKVNPMMPFSYLLSGGVSKRNFISHFLYPYIRKIEKLLFESKWSMFVYIELEFS